MYIAHDTLNDQFFGPFTSEDVARRWIETNTDTLDPLMAEFGPIDATWSIRPIIEPAVDPELAQAPGQMRAGL